MALVQDAVRYLAEAEAELRRREGYKIRRYFQDEGPTRRDLYPKVMQFFAAGAQYRERAIIAGNRTGKTEAGAYETTLHLTGEYPHWWEGKRFSEPVRGWAAGTTFDKTKEIVQAKLLGPETARGTGMIPARSIVSITMKGGGSVEAATVRHEPSGGLSLIRFRSYDQGRTAFEGTEQHLIWLDEEPPLDVYTECLLRTMATGDFPGGILYMTFTPLRSLTDVVQRFMPNGVMPAGGIVQGDR